MTETDPVLNPALQAQEFADAFARNGRVHIPDVLAAESAARVHRCLAQETEFATVTRNGDGYLRLGAEVTRATRGRDDARGLSCGAR